MALNLEDKKEILEENNRLLIFPFLKQPTPVDGMEESDTIDAIVTHYLMQLTVMFQHYGFDTDSEIFDRGMNVTAEVLTATLYKTRNLDHDFADDVENMFKMIEEMQNAGDDKVVKFVPDIDIETA